MQPDSDPTYGRSLLERLRAETRLQHERCEAAVDLTARTSSFSGYGDLVGLFYGFGESVLAKAADILALAPAELVDGMKRRQTRGVVDLAAVGGCQPSGAVTTLLSPGSLSQQLGALYVLEGSALGGTVIGHRFRQVFGEAAAGLRYFSGDEASTAAHWRQFQTFANELEMNGDIRYAEVRCGASQGFDHFLRLAARS